MKLNDQVESVFKWILTRKVLDERASLGVYLGIHNCNWANSVKKKGPYCVCFVIVIF